MLGLLPKIDRELAYGPATWGKDAYIKSFEKFTYANPANSIATEYPDQWRFALWAVRREYRFLRNSVMLPMVATDKNTESTPAFPKSIFYKTENAYLEDYGMEEYVREYEEVKNGKECDVLWYMFLKKEILKKEKIQSSDIRQILCADPCFARIGLVFEQDQNARMKNQTEKRHGQCGWSPFEGGWDQRMRRLERSGNTYIEMDWTRYDGTIPNEVFKAIKNIRFSFLRKEYRTPENRKVYDWYCNQLVNRYVLMPSGEVTKQHCGNPSGQVSTTMDNNMCNTFLQAFEFMYTNGLDFEAAKAHWLSYDTLVYGDDRLTSTPLIPDDYAERVIDMYRTIFGMWVKEKNVKISSTLEGLSFCGFTNREIRGKYMPVPANVDKMLASLLTPCHKLPDIEALHGKLLSYKIMFHNLPDEDYGKQFIDLCLFSVEKHMRARGGDPITFTTDVLNFLWRGGP